MNKDLDIIIEKMLSRNHLMINMVDDLLSYSKIMTRSHPFSVCNCNKILKQTLINLEETISTTKADIIYKELPDVMGNESLLISLFQNIIENGIKYAKPDVKPIINISLREDEKKIYPHNEWIFSFKDNGIGISKNDINYLFQIFHRLKVKKNTKGSGIGLAFCKKIIERHKGKIWVESKEGEGSNFLFTLPKI
jgi:light-regulated signal transduction histidine kinase (bacteriophytochrome)